VTAIKDGKYGFAGSDALAASRAQVTDASFGKPLVMVCGRSRSPAKRCPLMSAFNRLCGCVEVNADMLVCSAVVVAFYRSWVRA